MNICIQVCVLFFMGGYPVINRLVTNYSMLNIKKPATLAMPFYVFMSNT